MREKYESLPLTTLRDLAKARGIRGISTMRKAELIERMLEEDERDKAAAASENEEKSPEEKNGESTRAVPVQAEEKAAEEPERTAPERKPVNQEQAMSERRNINREQPAQERRNDNIRRVVRPHNMDQDRRPRQSSGADGDQDRRPRQSNSAEGEQERRPRQQYNAEGTEERRQAPRPAAQQEQPQAREGDEEIRVPAETAELDSGSMADGILEVMPDGYGFIRCENYLPGENDIYVSPSQIRRFNLKTGDIIRGNIRIRTQGEKFSALLYVTALNGYHPNEGQRRPNFEDMTPIFPDERLVMERPGGTTAMRIVDLISPIGKGQRGMIVSPPKAGKTTLLKDVAKSILRNNKEMHLIILLIDERPEEVTDIKEAIQGPNVEVIYSTFDELPEHHKRVSEMVIERARRLVEHKKDVTILLDSITRLARAYNLIIPPSGRTLSGGLDPAALHMPKRFFGAARNMREGGSLTILATALVDTGSKMDDVIYEEFKGTGNMELVLDRKLQERRVFPAIDIQKSGTRREDLLLTREEQEAVYNMRKALNGMKAEDAVEQILNMFARTRSNAEFVQMVRKQRF